MYETGLRLSEVLYPLSRVRSAPPTVCGCCSNARRFRDGPPTLPAGMKRLNTVCWPQGRISYAEALKLSERQMLNDVPASKCAILPSVVNGRPKGSSFPRTSPGLETLLLSPASRKGVNRPNSRSKLLLQSQVTSPVLKPSLLLPVGAVIV